MTFDPHPVRLRVVDADGECGTVHTSRVVSPHWAWGFAMSRVTEVFYDDGRREHVVEYEDDERPMLTTEPE